MRSVQKVSTLVRAAFVVYNSADAGVTGLVAANFTKLLQKDGVDDATAISVVEVTSGRYEATFTPASTGVWTLVLRHATHNPRGWIETFDVTTNGADLGAATKDGYTVMEHLGIQSAMLVGKVTGGPGSPIFRSANDAANRVAMTADSSGNRSAVTITP